ncbi:GIY-YIG nuclease family protein [Novipirellula artificiosorum]|uniref:UvrABC system protein C n=1 Tax=Novipirellula artificiosorum TaxID=2528016 RepID=A0A5C6D3U6_9BACT|nr:GIY-YIG nuclease family protein [Novipirellula artificiosorum]TWU30554.1 UvrABC system protein C [Novipirellula artificiosorum]
MEAMWRDEPAFGFGIDSLNPHAPRRSDAIGGLSKKQLREQLCQRCPRVPGVYGMLDRKGNLIYVGKSKSLRSRLLSYFADSNAEEKGGRIVENTRAIQWETQPSEFAALLREQQLIRRFSPRWNVQGVPKRQRPVYLCLGRMPAPYFFLAAKPPEQCVAVEGPFYGAGRMQRAIDGLNKAFKLRDCSQKQVFHFAEQMQLFDLDHRPGCLRLELGTCVGPCAAACTRDTYQMQVNAAESFLDGFNDEPLVLVREQMEQASENQQYELAARACRTLASLDYVHRKLSILANARREYTFVYPVSGYDGCNTWYLIHSGEVADVASAPRTPEEYAALKPKLLQWKAVTANRVDRGHGAYPHTLALVASWFRKNRSEQDRTFLPEQAGRRYRSTSIRQAS